MKKATLIITALAVAVATLFTGCTTYPSFSPEDALKAKQFKTHPTKANIYVYRTDYTLNAGETHIYLDGKRVYPNTSARRYHLLQVKPGKHEIKASSGRVHPESTITLNTEVGKNYFLEQEVQTHLITAKVFLHKVPTSAGIEGVKKCKLVSIVRDNTTYIQEPRPAVLPTE